MQKIFRVDVKGDIIGGEYKGYRAMIERVNELQEGGWDIDNLIIKEVGTKKINLDKLTELCRAVENDLQTQETEDDNIKRCLIEFIKTSLNDNDKEKLNELCTAEGI